MINQTGQMMGPTPDMLQAMLTDPRATPQQRAAAVAQLSAMGGGGGPQAAPRGLGSAPVAAPAATIGGNPSAWLQSGADAAGGGDTEEPAVPGVPAGGAASGDLSGWHGDFMQMIKKQLASDEGGDGSGELTSEDKSLALARAGFGMAASQSPHFGVALGEGAVLGLQGLDKMKAQRATERLRRDAMLQQAGLTEERLAETERAAREREQAARDALAERKRAAEADLERKKEHDAEMAGQANLTAGIRQQMADAAAERAAAATAAAPTGVAPVSPEQAKTAGIPVEGIPNPYVNVGPKAQEEMYKTNEKLFETGEMKQAAQDQTNAQVRADLQRFKELNATGETGPSNKIIGVGGVKKFLSSNLQEMDSITSRLAPVFRNGLPGSASNLDVQMFKGSGPEIIKDKEVNDNRIAAMDSALQNAQDYGQFQRDFFAVHHHLQGAKKAWNGYLEANPIFDHSKDAAPFTLNANRKSYQEWFGGSAVPATVSAPTETVIEYVRDPTTGKLRPK